jgi:hypothetical protein
MMHVLGSSVYLIQTELATITRTVQLTAGPEGIEPATVIFTMVKVTASEVIHRCEEFQKLELMYVETMGFARADEALKEGYEEQ